MGRAAASSATPATASTACSARCNRSGDKIRVHPGPARGDGGLHGVGATPSSPANSASASRPPGPARRTCSPGCTMPGSITCRCWRSPASRRAPRSARTTSRSSTSSACSRTSPAPSCSRRWCRRRCATWSTARSASRSASARVTALILPNDLQDVPYEEPPRKHGAVHSGVGYTAPKVVPYDADLRRAAEVLNAGKKVAILVGAGALARDRRGDRGRRPAAGRRRQGAARQGGAARRPALGDRLDRPARHQAVAGT